MNPPLLGVEESYSNGSVVLSLQGSLSGQTVAELGKRAAKLKERANLQSVTLNLAELTYVDSQGLNLLVNLHRHFTEKDIEFRLVNVNENILLVFKVSNLVNLFEIGPPPESETGRIRQHREALWQSHAFTNQLLAALGEAVLGLDLDGRILFANPAAEKVLGWEEAELLGRYLSELVPTVDSNGKAFRVATLAQENGDSGTPPVQRVELTLTNRDGKQLHVEIVATAIYQGGARMGTVLGIRDLTGKKQALSELKRLAKAVDQAAETILIAGEDGTIEYVNPAFEKLTGYSRSEVIGTRPKILRRSDKVYKDLWKTLRQGYVWSGRIVDKRKDGGQYEAEATISPVFDSDGKITTYVCVMRDVTEEIALQKKLWESQKFEAIAQLAGGVAHDFNNLLTTVMGNLGMARHSIPPELRTFLENAEKACLRGASLIEQMLLYSRKSEPEIATIHPNEVVKEVVELARQTIDRRIEVICRLDEDLACVEADANQLHQVLLNLVLNARDAVDEDLRRRSSLEGGKKGSKEPYRICVETSMVHLDEDSPELAVDALPGSYAVATVSDNGVGMSPETMEHLFEPFFTTKEEGMGTGLGLATVYGIIKNHRGWISVESEEGVGSTFRIYLPVSDREAPPTDPAEKSTELRGGTETLLVVDDEESIRDVARASLESLGYRVVTASDGKEVLEIYDGKRSEIDLIILDLSLPKLSGREVLKELRRSDPEVRVLICSGYPPKVLGGSGIEEPVSYLKKPYRVAELARKVREVLDAS